MSRPEPNSDAWLDAELRGVAVPADLLDRLKAVPREASKWSDAELDAEVRNVAVPAALLARLERLGRRQAMWARAMQLATAASLLISLGSIFALLLVSFLMSVKPPSIAQTPADGNPLVVQMPTRSDADDLMDGSDWAVNSGANWLPEDLQPPAMPELELPTHHAPDDRLADVRRLFGPGGLDPIGKTALLRWQDLQDLRVGPNSNCDLPDLRWAPSLKSYGMEYPLVPGFDIRVPIQTGFRPFVRPAAHPELRSINIPLGTGTETYDLLRRYVAHGELPRPGMVRTEDFLAAMDYPFPRPTQQPLGLTMAGGPSPLHPTTLFVQVGVQAKEVALAPHLPIRLTFLVDVSASMEWGSRLEMVAKAVSEILDQLSPEDRVSLVTFNDQGRVLVEDAGPDDWPRIREAIDRLEGQGPTSLGAGLREAYPAAQPTMPDDPHRSHIVLLTDALSQLDPATLLRAMAKMERAVGDGVHFDVIDLGQQGRSAGSDPQLDRLARAGQGKVFRATSRQQIGWDLDEVIDGESKKVAAEVRLRVTFNPQSVFAYRLLGHEPAIVGLNPAPLSVDFYAGQSATALFEIQEMPGSVPELATAELTWRDPNSGQTKRLEQRLLRSSVARRPNQSSPALQQATVAALVAEVLRISPYLPSRSVGESLDQLSRASKEVNTTLFHRPSYQELVEILEKATRSRPTRNRLGEDKYQ